MLCKSAPFRLGPLFHRIQVANTQNRCRTGIKGVTEARSIVRGFGQVELKKLPVLGTFYANKPNLMSLSTFGIADEE